MVAILAEMDVSDIARHRLMNQQIAAPRFQRPDQVVSWLGAVQAQDFAGAKWSVGLRLRSTANCTDADIEKALTDRTIVRTWPMRGTLHFVAAKDARWMLALLTPRVIAGSGKRQQQLELDDRIFGRSRDAFTAALQGGKQRTRDEMYQTLEQAGISTEGQRGYHILWRHAQEGLICFAAPQGKQQTFALLDEWVPPVKSRDERDRDSAIAELVKRYFTSHGPATLQDFVWWSGLKVTEARAGLESVKADLVCETIAGITYWLPRDSTPTAEVSATNTYLLPGFDEYLLGYTDRSAVLEAIHAPRICPGNNGVFAPTLVVDGRVVGTWKRTVQKKGVALTTIPFSTTAPREASPKEEATAAEQYARFMGLPLIFS